MTAALGLRVILSRRGVRRLHFSGNPLKQVGSLANGVQARNFDRVGASMQQRHLGISPSASSALALAPHNAWAGRPAFTASCSGRSNRINRSPRLPEGCPGSPVASTPPMSRRARRHGLDGGDQVSHAAIGRVRRVDQVQRLKNLLVPHGIAKRPKLGPVRCRLHPAESLGAVKFVEHRARWRQRATRMSAPGPKYLRRRG